MNQTAFSGDDLRARREELGLTVDDVYRKLRIPPYCIEALEAGAVDRLPAMTYASGFLKTYCEMLDLEPDSYLDGLRELANPNSGFFGGGTRSGSGRNAAWLGDIVTWAAICAILVLGWITYSVVVKPPAEEGEGQVEAGTQELHVPDTPILP